MAGVLNGRYLPLDLIKLHARYFDRIIWERFGIQNHWDLQVCNIGVSLKRSNYPFKWQWKIMTFWLNDFFAHFPLGTLADLKTTSWGLIWMVPKRKTKLQTLPEWNLPSTELIWLLTTTLLKNKNTHLDSIFWM